MRHRVVVVVVVVVAAAAAAFLSGLPHISSLGDISWAILELSQLAHEMNECQKRKQKGRKKTFLSCVHSILSPLENFISVFVFLQQPVRKAIMLNNENSQCKRTQNSFKLIFGSRGGMAQDQTVSVKISPRDCVCKMFFQGLTIHPRTYLGGGAFLAHFCIGTETNA